MIKGPDTNNNSLKSLDISRKLGKSSMNEKKWSEVLEKAMNKIRESLH
jgi:hypothetical protein